MVCEYGKKQDVNCTPRLVRGGFNLSISGGINFEGSAFSPMAGEFDLRVLGQNVTYDGDPIGEPTALHTEGNPAFGQYNMTLHLQLNRLQ